ncbi:hypothetical protein BU24DRAFT_198484 [Aaosphaeria arxii CBS 175.79]|uniref:Uncharacterized protein n=1 Tax=Aaosphaeria arxii CBS 175.79 TaxID=1450172 RepID=A0A6A5XSY1_9PLEO|nr:uncharacterized protein BU24DRAFT_198484 [Aaosphaeria arxii CBS 175.79]KAF2016302.1 hypothetical protein BU24DRAFT_198484 [Aaosphaeria arxii CBS 175.79]
MIRVLEYRTLRIQHIPTNAIASSNHYRWRVLGQCSRLFYGRSSGVRLGTENETLNLADSRALLWRVAIIMSTYFWWWWCSFRDGWGQRRLLSGSRKALGSES